eukprot:2871856-Amphidinium_carterae.1
MNWISATAVGATAFFTRITYVCYCECAPASEPALELLGRQLDRCGPELLKPVPVPALTCPGPWTWLLVFNIGVFTGGALVLGLVWLLSCTKAVRVSSTRAVEQREESTPPAAERRFLGKGLLSLKGGGQIIEG